MVITLPARRALASRGENQDGFDLKRAVSAMAVADLLVCGAVVSTSPTPRANTM